MPIEDFDGETVVAFADISGFKEMMKDGRRAVGALDVFYQAGFDTLRQVTSINGFFVSDCGILFARDPEPARKLESILRVVQRLNRTMLQNNIMLTTSLAWGAFNYHNRIEFPGINKQPVYGNAYLSAYLDGASGKPALEPGHCRILKVNLPADSIDSIEQRDFITEDEKHYYFHWMVSDPQDIPEFTRRYRDSYRRKYAGFLEALQRPRG